MDRASWISMCDCLLCSSLMFIVPLHMGRLSPPGWCTGSGNCDITHDAGRGCELAARKTCSHFPSPALTAPFPFLPLPAARGGVRVPNETSLKLRTSANAVLPYQLPLQSCHICERRLNVPGRISRCSFSPEKPRRPSAPIRTRIGPRIL